MPTSDQMPILTRWLESLLQEAEHYDDFVNLLFTRTEITVGHIWQLEIPALLAKNLFCHLVELSMEHGYDLDEIFEHFSPREDIPPWHAFFRRKNCRTDKISNILISWADNDFLCPACQAEIGGHPND